MGGKGRHPDKALTAVQVRMLKVHCRYADGNGLYLVVEPSGSKRWILRTVIQSIRRDIGLGGVSLVSLAEARDGLPPEKWSSLRYGFEPCGGYFYGTEEAYG